MFDLEKRTSRIVLFGEGSPPPDGDDGQDPTTEAETRRARRPSPGPDGHDGLVQDPTGTTA